MNDGATADGEHRLRISFVGSGSEYFRIWVVNLLLTLVLFERLAQRGGADEAAADRGPPMAFASHPADAERVRFFRDATVGLR